MPPIIEIETEWEKIGEILNYASLKDWQDIFNGINSNDTIERMFKILLQEIDNNPDDYDYIFKGIQNEYLFTLNSLIEKALQHKQI